MMIKVVIQESVSDDDTETWETRHEAQSDNRIVIAGMLRAIADSLDPPKPNMREHMNVRNVG
jgi:hypothetical protein